MTSTSQAATTETPITISREDDLQQVRGRLDEVITAHAGDRRRWAQELSEVANEVLVAVQAHRQAFDSPDGMLGQIIARAPRLANRARSQEIEHAVLLSEAALLEAALRRQLAEDTVHVPELRDRASILLERIRDHVARTSDLIYEAFFSDLGGES